MTENEIFEVLLKNSLNELKKVVNLNESVEIEPYEKMLGDIIRDNIKTYIAYDIADVQPQNTPNGIMLARPTRLDKFEIIKKSISVKTKKNSYKVTQEFIDDLNAVSGTTEIFQDFVISKTKNDETMDLVNFLKTNAIAVSNLTLPQEAKENNETNLFYINKKVNDEIIKLNKTNFRTFDGFCILPQSQAGGILGMSFTYSKINQQLSSLNRANNFYLGSVNNVKYYLNPDSSADDVIVGLNSKIERGVSSLIYCPYSIMTNSALDNNTGEKIYNIWVRDLYEINPLHSTTNPLLVKFKIQ